MTPKQATWEELAVSAAPAKPEPPISAAHLTHELRAPVTSIRLGLEILAEQISQRITSHEKYMLSLAIRNTHRLEGLVNDIMDYSKVAAGRMTVNKEACESRALVDEAFDAMQASATAKGIRLLKDVDPLMPRCAAEGRRIVQILVNLLSNAIKNTPTRGRVTISVREGNGEHLGTLLFKVRDTGCGIAPENLSKVFHMFEQADTGRRVGGTGIGLSLSRAMVELHGGRIWAESWVNVGSVFYFTIPIAPVDMARPVEVYAKPVEVTGLLADVSRRFNAFLALFI